ncbi:MAG: zinc-ribbon domain containing protein [Candidatus Eremiobacteraeota bacterium]|nr:zinc-ribbon domain containing protein [Candidatus Eremiobacteraeota bacterium]
MEDKILGCKDCGSEFVFTVREQRFFADKGFVNEPVRCRECRQARRSRATAGTPSRPSHTAVCAACGVETTVPFRPRGDRPVYCRACYSMKVPAGV